MSFIKCLTLGCVLCLVTLCFISPARTLAQTKNSAESAQGDRDQTLQQLLAEVRELRLAVQRATVSNTRFQMLMDSQILVIMSEYAKASSHFFYCDEACLSLVGWPDELVRPGNSPQPIVVSITICAIVVVAQAPEGKSDES